MSRLSICMRREWPSLILGGMLIALLFTALAGPRGPRDLLLLRHRRTLLEAKRASLIAQQRKLETSVQNLRSNDRYIEHLIRHELGYVRPDEMVYKFTEPGTASP